MKYWGHAHDPQHFTFARTSGLSRSDFRDSPRVPWLRVAIIVAAFVLGGMAFLFL
jgi:hypothetical protein